MDIKDKSDFQPSSQTLRKWLGTRKPDLTIAGMNVPGFLGDSGNSTDTTWFWVAVLGEIAGLVATMYGGVRGGGEFLIVALLGVLMFIFCDFFFASKLHRNEGKKCTLKTEKFLLDDSNTAKIGMMEIELQKGGVTDFILKAAIILIALIKVAAIVLLGVFNSLMLYIPFMIIFLIVAYVHIRHTGYYFAYYLTQKAIDKERRQYNGKVFEAIDAEQMVETPLPLRNLPIRHSPHEIVANPDKDGNHYIIRAKGVLTDNDIICLINKQEEANKIPLAKACRRFQLGNLNAQNNQ